MKYVKYESFMDEQDSYLLDAQRKWEAFNNAKHKLPDKLISLYNQQELFHGMKVFSFSIIKDPEKLYSCAKLEVGQGISSERYIFKYCGIDSISFDLADDTHYKKQSYIKVCLVDELYLDEEYICHNIMLYDGKEISLRAKAISVEIKQKDDNLRTA